MRWLIIALSVAVACVVAAWLWISVTYVPGVSPLDLLSSVTTLVKLTMALSLISGIVGVIGAVARQRTLALIMAGVAAGWGLLGTLYNEGITQYAISYAGGVAFAVTAPNRLETLMALGLGLGLPLAILLILGRGSTTKP